MTRVALTGNHAVSEAIRQINPDVVAAYPITPQSPIVEKVSEFVADGVIDTEMIKVESEHSAMSACVGASAAGARAMTATSSAGLALMWEILGVASGCRLPIVMGVANRALSAPINIHCDHNDSMGCRDHSWIQIYSEDGQEAYDHTLLAVRIAEHPKVLLPAMVMQDGFVISHGVEGIETLSDAQVKKYVGIYKPKKYLLNIKSPVTMGPLALQDYYFEIKRQQVKAMEEAKKVYVQAGKELSKLTGRSYNYFEAYKLKDARIAIVAIGSTARTTKSVVDKLRKKGKKVGLLKIKLFRPFPYEEVAKALEGVGRIGVLDRSISYGAYSPLMLEIKSALYGAKKRPLLENFMYGMGGRNIFEKDIVGVIKQLETGKITERYVGCRE